MPGLTDALKRAGWQPPIIFTEQTGALLAHFLCGLFAECSPRQI